MPLFTAIRVQLLRDKTHWSLVGEQANGHFTILGVPDPPITPAMALQVAQVLATGLGVATVIDHTEQKTLASFQERVFLFSDYGTVE